MEKRYNKRILHLKRKKQSEESCALIRKTHHETLSWKKEKKKADSIPLLYTSSSRPLIYQADEVTRACTESAARQTRIESSTDGTIFQRLEISMREARDAHALNQFVTAHFSYDRNAS